ncbi:acetyltransferase, partial [Candidatus Magnetomorum sp. HK-1]
TIKDGTFTIKPPDYSFIIGSNTITVECTDSYGAKGSDSKTLIDYAVPDKPPFSLSPNQISLAPKETYQFVFGGFPDPSPDQKFHYRVIIDDNNDFSSPVFEKEVPGSPFDVGSNTLLPDNTYYWKIRAENEDVIQGPWAESWFKIISPIAPVSVSGIIYGIDNSPVANAMIRLEQERQIIYSGIYSDDHGAFSFSDVESGDYDIVCLASSYINYIDSVSVSDHSVQQDIFLVPTEINWKTESQLIEESVGTVIIEAELNGPTVDNVSVPYIVSGSAQGAFIDHGIVDSSFEITAGDTVFSQTFPIIDDDDDESEETIVLSLETPVNAVKGLQSTHTVFILPSDPVNDEPDPLPYFSFSTIGSTQVVGKPFDVVISAYDSDGNIMDYSGDVFVWASHSQNIIPGIVYFNQGMWMNKMTINEPGSNIVLHAERNNISGKSNAFSVIHLANDEITEIPNNSGRIEGKISSNNGLLLTGKMSVHLSKEKDGTDIYTTETENGYYSIENIECGTYFLYASYGNYAENTSAPYLVNIPCGRTVTKDLSEDLFISFCNQGNKIPVLLLPGIMGSSDTNNIFPTLPKYAPQWNSRELMLFDPLYKVGWRDLKKLLTQKYGYKQNCTLFDVPYDWRLDINESSKKYLEKWIDYAKKQSGSNKVNIIAHSMGGLLARSYIQGVNYKNDVARLAMVGTPNHGAALAYYLWEGGDPNTADQITDPDTADQISDYVTSKLHFYLMTANLLHHNLCGDPLISFQFSPNLNMNNLLPVKSKMVFTQKAARDAWRMIHNFVPSIRQLLPTYDGALNYSGSDMNILKCQNAFLTNLNLDPDILRMIPFQNDQSTYDNDKVITKIFAGTNNSTVQTINVDNPPESSDFYTPKKIHELCYIPPNDLSSDLFSGNDIFYPDGTPDRNPQKTMIGDGTVLLDSVNITYEDHIIAPVPNELKDVAHSGLIKAYANEIADFITQENDVILTKRQKRSSNLIISDADPVTAISIGIIGRAQPYIINPNSLGSGIHYQNLNREDDIPESTVEIQSDSGNIMIASPEAGLYTVFIRGIYKEDYYLFMTYHTKDFSDTLTFHAFNHAETTHFTFNLDANGLTVNQATDVTLAVSSQAIVSDSTKTKLVWELSDNDNVASFNVYAKKTGQPYYSKIANTLDKFFVTENQWAENDSVETMFYAVSAVDHNGNESFLSPFVLNRDDSLSEEPPTLVIESSIKNVSPFSGLVTFNVNNSNNDGWSVQSKESWLDVSSDSHSITVSYETNTGESRSGYIDIIVDNCSIQTLSVVQPAHYFIYEGSKSSIQINSQSYFIKDGIHYLVWSNGYEPSQSSSSTLNYDKYVKLSTSDDGFSWTTTNIIQTKYGSINHRIAFDKDGFIHIVYNEKDDNSYYGGHWNLIHATNINNTWEKSTLFSDVSTYGYYSPAFLFMGKDNKIHLFYNRNGWYRYNAPLYEKIWDENWSKELLISNINYGDNDPDDFENILLGYDYDLNDNLILYISSGFYNDYYHGPNIYTKEIHKIVKQNGAFTTEKIYKDISYDIRTNNSAIVYSDISENILSFHLTEDLGTITEETLVDQIPLIDDEKFYGTYFDTYSESCSIILYTNKRTFIYEKGNNGFIRNTLSYRVSGLIANSLVFNKTGGEDSVLSCYELNHSIQPVVYYLNVQPSALNISSNSGTISFSVSTNTNWNVFSDEDWFSVEVSDYNLIVNYESNP